MAKAKKVYTIVKHRRGKETEITGTVEYLSKYFGYTLTCGHSWKNSINPNPKTIKSLIKNLQNSSIYTFAFNIINYNSNLQQHPVLPLISGIDF